MLKRQLNSKYIILIFICISLIVYSCGKKKIKSNYVAKVENEKLSQQQLNEYLASVKYNNFYKNEFIRNWVQKEVLYQAALEENLEQDTLFKFLISESEKELLGNLIIQKKMKNSSIEISKTEIENYFKINKNEFALTDDAIVLNSIEFNNEDKAILFRKTLEGSKWNRAVNVFLGDSSVVSKSSNKLFYKYQLEPAELLRTAQNLGSGEFSVVKEIGKNRFVVIQIIDKLKKGTIPKLDFVYNTVWLRIKMKKQNELIREYINSLYSKYEIEIKR